MSIKLLTLSCLMAVGSLACAAPGRALFEGADPGVLVEENQVTLYPTGDGNSLSAWTSSDLINWKKHASLIRQGEITWIKDGAPRHFLWAPHMLSSGGKYYLYYSVGPQDPTPSRIGVAICVSAQGPCGDSGKPLITGGNGFEAIDPAVFTDSKSGKTLLYAGGSNGAKLRVYELAPDLISIASEIKIDQPPGFTEAPWMHTRNGIYYLSYSAGRWNDASYAVHYAISLSPTGPWKFAGIILQSDRRYKGPGHHSFFKDPSDSQTYMAYHRWERQSGNGPYNGARSIALAKVRYSPTGLIEPINMKD